VRQHPENKQQAPADDTLRSVEFVPAGAKFVAEVRFSDPGLSTSSGSLCQTYRSAGFFPIKRRRIGENGSEAR